MFFHFFLLWDLWGTMEALGGRSTLCSLEQRYNDEIWIVGRCWKKPDFIQLQVRANSFWRLAELCASCCRTGILAEADWKRSRKYTKIDIVYIVWLVQNISVHCIRRLVPWTSGDVQRFSWGKCLVCCILHATSSAHPLLGESACGRCAAQPIKKMRYFFPSDMQPAVGLLVRSCNP